MTIQYGETYAGRLARWDDVMDDVLETIEIEPDAWREAEFVQAQMILDTMVGKTVANADIEETRIVITTADGNKYFFYGFMGEDRTREQETGKETTPAAT